MALVEDGFLGLCLFLSYMPRNLNTRRARCSVALGEDPGTRFMASRLLKATVLFPCCDSNLECVLLRQILQNQKTDIQFLQGLFLAILSLGILVCSKKNF